MPSHPDRVRKNYIWICPQCLEKFRSQEDLDEHIKDMTFILDYTQDGPIISNMHWSGNSYK